MVSRLSRYLAQDRRDCLARGEQLPERASGCALIADIAGFTALGKRLTEQHGVQRGIEELGRIVDSVYDRLNAQVELHGGSVVSFAGDALVCWFADSDEGASHDAVRCALQMVGAMDGDEGMALKIALASGPVSRFVAGDPDIQLFDLMGGATIERLARAEALARQGDIVIDQATHLALEERHPGAYRVGEWRTDRSDRFAVLDIRAAASMPPTADPIAELALQLAEPTADADLRPWILPAVREREHAGHSTLLTELRPTVALFARLASIDCDGDPRAADKLDHMVRRVQATAARHGGALLQVTLGDKGGYAYASFGAPFAHEDDALRAVRAAREMLQPSSRATFPNPLGIGLSAGAARTGAYGAARRSTYGALGDDVNLAARIMALTTPGDIVVSNALRRALVPHFVMRALDPVRLKGHDAPIALHLVEAERSAHQAHLQERRYRLAMVGRQQELARAEAALADALLPRAQTIAVTGEAGIGKSRLLAEVSQYAQRHGFTVLTGRCDAAGRNTPYLPWRSIWRSLLLGAADANELPYAQVESLLRAQLRTLAPNRVQGMPTMAPLLGLPIEDNEFTRPLDPKARGEVLTALLSDALKQATTIRPVLVVIEDLHWIDPLSLQLLEELARRSSSSALCFLLACRPADESDDTRQRIERLQPFTRIALQALSPDDVERLVDSKLTLWDPDVDEGLAAALASKLNAQAEGNPFYVEELLNHLHERHGDLQAMGAYARTSTLELPTTLQALILSRIDRLTEPQRVALKAASIVGRQFRVNWLHGYYPALGELAQVKADLVELERLDLTPVDSPEPELGYVFKHALIRDVTYMAASALRISSPTQVASIGNIAMPTLQDTVRSCLSTTQGARSESISLTAISEASSHPLTPFSTTTNSSPPNRLTVSVSRTDKRSRSATSRSSASPVWWPSESLTRLNRSRSMNNTATGWPDASDCSIASRSRRSAALRLGNPVNVSWCARNLMRSPDALRSVMSRQLRM